MKLPKCLAGCFIACLLSAAASVVLAQMYEITSRSVPPEFKSAFAFFEFIQYRAPTDTGFDERNTPHWDIPRFLSFISSNGVVFSDPDGVTKVSGRKSPKEISTALKERKGDLFRVFAHIAHIYSQPYKQYSELTFEKRGSEVQIQMAGWYRFTFIEEKGTLRLAQCAFIAGRPDD